MVQKNLKIRFLVSFKKPNLLKFRWCCLKMETIFMNSENSETNESKKLFYEFNDRFNVKNPSKNIALANVSIYYTWKSIKPACDNNKFKISASTWNNEFDFPNGSFYITDIYSRLF